ncbi:DUF3038 domain-containing protein [Prochlorococcus sp. MIT 1341]|uniref:DUF3038 domain-containing protein n=1 Tax=Prochlorococcus sp. MIT 1341 TaxID=3096221 RepID=UPI0039BEF440
MNDVPVKSDNNVFIGPQRECSSPNQVIGRRGLERLDLLLLAIESLDFNGSEAMVFACEELGLQKLFPNRVELWKRRCHNPLRRTTRRGSLSSLESEALILLLCSMANRLYPLIHQLLSSKEPETINSQRWILMKQRLTELIKERMNPRRGGVKRLLYASDSITIHKDLVRTLALASGPGGVDRLRASLLDPTP